MSHKRSKLEIYLEVMKAIYRGTEKPTRIMYKTNLSWRPLTNVLKSLQDQGFITGHKKRNHTVYKVTEKRKKRAQILQRSHDPHQNQMTPYFSLEQVPIIGVIRIWNPPTKKAIAKY